jgi:predicted RNase H-like HicB family nuclease
MTRKYTPVIQKRGELYVAYVEELPGVITQGRTRTEAQRNLQEAMALETEANLEFAARCRARADRGRLKPSD